MRRSLRDVKSRLNAFVPLRRPPFTSLTSVEPFDDTATIAAFEPTMNFGGYVQFDLTGAFSLQPEVLFAAKGHRIRDKDAQPFTTSTGEVKLPAADRVVLVRYLEFPLLLRMSRRTHENTSVYLIGGPSFAMRRNAVIREVAEVKQVNYDVAVSPGHELRSRREGARRHAEVGPVDLAESDRGPVVHLQSTRPGSASRPRK